MFRQTINSPSNVQIISILLTKFFIYIYCCFPPHFKIFISNDIFAVHCHCQCIYIKNANSANGCLKSCVENEVSHVKILTFAIMAFIVSGAQLTSLKTIRLHQEAYKFGGRNRVIKPRRKGMRRYSKCLSGGEEEEGHSRFEDNSVTDSQVGTDIIPDVWKGAMEFSNLRGGTRAGLFRTPSSGGVQSATAAHDLPPPAVAVRNLMEQAHYGHLCTIMSEMHHRRRGYPFGSLIDFVPDDHGHPIFCFSPLGIHTRNVLADARCTLMVQIPGWTGLANARVTLFGDVYPMSAEKQEWARKYFLSKHPQETCQQWGNFSYYRMDKISDIYFMGGFGTVAWVDVDQYVSVQPDSIVVNGFKQSLKVLNGIFSKALVKILSDEIMVDDVEIISIDRKGIDIRVLQGNHFNVRRLSFQKRVDTVEGAKLALSKIIEMGSTTGL